MVRGPNDSFSGTALNISEGGIYIATDHPLTVGKPILVNTYLEGDESLNLSMEGIITTDPMKHPDVKVTASSLPVLFLTRPM